MTQGEFVIVKLAMSARRMSFALGMHDNVPTRGNGGIGVLAWGFFSVVANGENLLLGAGDSSNRNRWDLITRKAVRTSSRFWDDACHPNL